jgi:hypothetical protein
MYRSFWGRGQTLTVKQIASGLVEIAKDYQPPKPEPAAPVPGSGGVIQGGNVDFARPSYDHLRPHPGLIGKVEG